MLNKYFQNIDYNKIKYDKEGLYSITNYSDANTISEIILSLYNTKMLSILDCTGGLGGNSISFCKYFSNVTSLEINKNRFKMLENNIKLYNYNNIKLINDDSIEYLFKNYNNYDIYFIDPPWGGIDYKKNNNITLKMSNYKLIEIINILINKINDKLIVFKLPFNYNFNEFNLYNYKLYKINKYYIIIIYI